MHLKTLQSSRVNTSHSIIASLGLEIFNFLVHNVFLNKTFVCGCLSVSSSQSLQLSFCIFSCLTEEDEELELGVKSFFLYSKFSDLKVFRNLPSSPSFYLRLTSSVLMHIFSCIRCAVACLCENATCFQKQTR